VGTFFTDILYRSKTFHIFSSYAVDKPSVQTLSSDVAIMFFFFFLGARQRKRIRSPEGNLSKLSLFTDFKWVLN